MRTGDGRNWQATLTVLIGSGAALVGGAGIAVAVAVGLSGGGAQPEDALPADVFALARLDLDPSGDQKLAAFALARRIPDLEVRGPETLRDDVLRRVLGEGPAAAGLDQDEARAAYDRLVRPWIGDRAAVAGAPDLDGDGQPEVLAALAYDDRESAERLLPELVRELTEDEPVHYAFSSRHQYVLFAGSQRAADAAADPPRVLAESDTFSADLAALDGDQIAVAWADIGAGWASLPADLREQAGTVYGDDVQPAGRYVTGVHLEPDLVEVSGRSFALDLGSPALTAYTLGTETGTGLVGRLPTGAVAAVSAAGLGAQLEDLVEVFATSGIGGGEEGLAGLEEQLGLRIPEDLALLLGDETALGVYAADGSPAFGARTRGGDPAGALAVAQRLLTTLAEQAAPGAPTRESCEEDALGPCQGLPSASDLPPAEPLDVGAVAALSDGIAYGTSTEVLDLVVGSGGLGDSDVFRRAVPDAGSAASVVFADIQAALGLSQADGLDGAPDDRLADLEGFGVTSTGGPDGRFRLRLTLR